MTPEQLSRLNKLDSELLKDVRVLYTPSEYFDKFVSQFYNIQDLSFKDFFIEVCMTSNYKFYIPHTKLVEYGGAFNTQSLSELMRNFDSNGLKIGTHYIIKSNDGKVKKEYLLNSTAFKICITTPNNKYLGYLCMTEEVLYYYVKYLHKYNILANKKEIEMKKTINSLIDIVKTIDNFNKSM